MNEDYWIDVCVMHKDYSVTQHKIAIPSPEISVSILWDTLRSQGLVSTQVNYALSSYGQRVKLNDSLNHADRLECTQPLPTSPNQQRRKRLLRKKITP